MFFLLICLFVLFSLLTGYAIMKTLWLFAGFFGILAVTVLILMIKRYRRTNPSSCDSCGGSGGDCFSIMECPSTALSSKKGDCGGIDCGGADCAPDCSL